MSQAHRLMDLDELDIPGPALAQLMDELLAKDAAVRLRARGSSMAPFIRDGDAITVAPLRFAPPRLGEVVAFVRPGQANVVVHRVVGRHGDWLLIQGDNSAGRPDGLIRPDYLLGRVTRVERNWRSVWLGLGPERYVIAWLSRAGLLVPIRRRLAALLRPFRLDNSTRLHRMVARRVARIGEISR